MRFEGRIKKDGRWWLAEIPAFDALTQGRTKKEAFAMAADLVVDAMHQCSFVVAPHTMRTRLWSREHVQPSPRWPRKTDALGSRSVCGTKRADDGRCRGGPARSVGSAGQPRGSTLAVPAIGMGPGSSGSHDHSYRRRGAAAGSERTKIGGEPSRSRPPADEGWTPTAPEARVRQTSLSGVVDVKKARCVTNTFAGLSVFRRRRRCSWRT